MQLLISLKEQFTERNLSFAAKNIQGSPLYQSPEMIRDQKFSQKGDVYSFGVCLYEVSQALDKIWIRANSHLVLDVYRQEAF